MTWQNRQQEQDTLQYLAAFIIGFVLSTIVCTIIMLARGCANG